MKLKNNIDFLGKRKIFYAISIGIIVIGLLFNVIFGTKLDLQFAGGSIMTYGYTGEYNESDVRSAISSVISENFNITRGKGADSEEERFTISLTSSLDAETQLKLTAALEEKMTNQNLELINANSVDPTVGKDFLIKGIVTIIMASLIMIIYVGFRFKNIGGLSAGVMAVIALLHDITIVYLVFVLFRISLNDNFIAVVLTILGYSINDTIVIYDRIRENKKLDSKKTKLSDLVNKSINQSFKRTLMTSITTFMAVACIVVVAAIAGLTSILSFAIPMAVGVVVGTYSSICIAPTLWVMWKERKDKNS